jgi:hypothetical protein
MSLAPILSSEQNVGGIRNRDPVKKKLKKPTIPQFISLPKK